MIVTKTAQGYHIIILEPAQLDSLRAGQSIGCDNAEVGVKLLVLYTPDMERLQDLVLTGVPLLDAWEVCKGLAEKRERAAHPTIVTRCAVVGRGGSDSSGSSSN